MFGHFTYFLYTLIFTLPLIVFLWSFYRQILIPVSKKVLVITLLATFYGFLIWPYGLKMACWAYSSQKILNFNVLGVVFEDLVWWFLICLLLVSFIFVSAHFEDEKQSLFSSLLKNTLILFKTIFPFSKPTSQLK